MELLLFFLFLVSESGGAKILLDGRSWAERAPGYWVGPTVILHTNLQDQALKDEIFGPVRNAKDRIITR